MPVVPVKQRGGIGPPLIYIGRRGALFSNRWSCYAHPADLTETPNVNKPRPVRSLADLAAGFMADAFMKQGFASTELVTRWRDIVGPEIGAHTEPVKLQWQRATNGDQAEPATLVLRVEGPAAIEIQHQSNVILEQVNRYFGWQAVGRIALRQAPLSRHAAKSSAPKIDSAEAERVAANLTAVTDEDLRNALGRLGAAVKRR
jgi:hypothetical protein